MLNQVSVFAENTKGALRKMTAVLAAADVNIYSMLASDSAEFGIIRLVLTDPERALAELKKAGYQCHIDKVIAVEMGATPGSLDAILKHLEEANVSLDYLDEILQLLTSSFAMRICSRYFLPEFA